MPGASNARRDICTAFSSGLTAKGRVGIFAKPSTAIDFVSLMPQCRRCSIRSILQLCLCLSLSCGFTGCAAKLKKAAASSFMNDVAAATAKQNDVSLVTQALPTYVLLTEGLLESNPDDTDLLTSATQLYLLYGSMVETQDVDRSRRLYARAKDCGLRAFSRNEEIERLITAPYSEFEQVTDHLKRRDLPVVFWAASAWGAWISLSAESMAALADLPKVIHLMEWVLAKDEAYFAGSPHLFLGMYHAALPPVLGGRPEKALEHFDRALEISGGRSLNIKVQKARFYARQIFDRELYESLLKQVLVQPLDASEFTLQNATAKIMAKKLLEEIDEVF